MSMPVDVILGVDAIAAPLTGIGRYALALAQGLADHHRIDRLRFVSLLGHWVENPSFLTQADVGGEPATRSLRSRLAENKLAVRAFQAFVPSYKGWRLRNEASALFHSPNYFLPPFPGRSIATVHDLSHLFYPQFHPAARVDYMNRALPESLRRADHLITDAESVRQEIIDYYNWPAERVTAVPLGVASTFRPHTDDEILPVLQRLGLRNRAYCLYVGTVEPRKNLDRLLTAYEMLPASVRTRYPLIVAGAYGWQSDPIHQRMSRGADAGWLHYVSFIPQVDLPKLYAGARLFVYPSLYEGFGLPVLEAMASGVPILTSNLSSLPEVVGTAARLVNPHDTADIHAGLSSALEDDDWLLNAGRKGIVRATKFCWETCVNKTVKVYMKVLK